MAQLCAAIWPNILKGQERGAGASAGKGNQVIIGNQISERQEPLVHSPASCFTAHRPRHGTGGKARPSLAIREPWVEGRAFSSALSARCGLFTTPCTKHFFPLYMHSNTVPVFIHPNPNLALL